MTNYYYRISQKKRQKIEKKHLIDTYVDTTQCASSLGSRAESILDQLFYILKFAFLNSIHQCFSLLKR